MCIAMVIVTAIVTIIASIIDTIIVTVVVPAIFISKLLVSVGVGGVIGFLMVGLAVGQVAVGVIRVANVGSSIDGVDGGEEVLRSRAGRSGHCCNGLTNDVCVRND